MQQPIGDRRDQMDAQELLEEAELRFPEKIAGLERRHQEAMEAIEFGSQCDEELLDDLREDLRSLLRI